MRIKNKRLLALIAFFLLATLFFGLTFHNISPDSYHCSRKDEVTCTLCVLQDLTFKAFLPLSAAIALMTLSESAVNQKRSHTSASISRTFPLLC